MTQNISGQQANVNNSEKNSNNITVKNPQKSPAAIETKVYQFYVYGCEGDWTPLVQAELPAGAFFDTALQIAMVIEAAVVVARNNDPINTEPRKRVMTLATVFPDGEMRIRKAFLRRLYPDRPGFPYAAYEFTEQAVDDEIFDNLEKIRRKKHETVMRRIEDMKKRAKL